MLHLCAFADWERVLALDAPPEKADFDVAVYHYARRYARNCAGRGGTGRVELGLLLLSFAGQGGKGLGSPCTVDLFADAVYFTMVWCSNVLHARLCALRCVAADSTTSVKSHPCPHPLTPASCYCHHLTASLSSMLKTRTVTDESKALLPRTWRRWQGEWPTMAHST